jgi:hypothetical protein
MNKTQIANAVIGAIATKTDQANIWIKEDSARFKNNLKQGSMLDFENDMFLDFLLQYNNSLSDNNNKLTNRQAPRKNTVSVHK